MRYIEPEMEVTKFNENEVATDITIASGHRPGDGNGEGGGDLSYEDFI